MVQQFIHGTQYVDELVMMRVKDKGDLYVHQDANWNVIGATDLGRHVVERSIYTPYGELTVHQDTGFGDRDGDQDVDSTDKGTVGTTCTGTVSGACRILDLDFDGDYDSADATKFDALTQGAMRHPGRPATNVNQPFTHQGLLFEPELAQYQNRARQYDPGKRRFAQRDPLGYIDGLHSYTYAQFNPLVRTDPSGHWGGCLGSTFVYYCWCKKQTDWTRKCRCPCAHFFAKYQKPPTNSPPQEGDACYYPNRFVCWPSLVPLQCWESQCVCQCAGDSPGMNCMRGCIRCAHENGAPPNTIEAEEWCKSRCSLTFNEKKRLDCCLNNDVNHGGCGSSPLGPAPPKNPNPNNPTCTSMPIP